MPPQGWGRSLAEALGLHSEEDLEWNGRAAASYDSSYSGRWFEVIASWDRPDTITADDLVAVTMLGVDVPPHASAWILGPGRSQISALLSEVPADVDIWEVDETVIGDEGPAAQVWALLQEGCWPSPKAGNGINAVIAGKLLAAKRPRLIPVYDSRVQDALQLTGQGLWRGMREELETPEHRLVAAVPAVSASSITGSDRERPLLRQIDVILWMRYGGHEADSDLGKPPLADMKDGGYWGWVTRPERDFTSLASGEREVTGRGAAC